MRTAIIFTTKYGCTEKVAAKLKSQMGGQVDLVNLSKEQSPSLSEYDTVILGGSIYYGQVNKRLKQFMTGALAELSKKKVGLFLCAGHPDPETRIKELESAFPTELFRQAVWKDILGDEVTYDKLSFLDKFIYSRVAKSKKSHSHIHNDKIEAFAHALARA